MEQIEQQFGNYRLIQFLGKGTFLDELPLQFPRIPLPLTSLIGRETELEVVRDLLLRPEVRLVTLSGAGGIGKTHLALTLGNELQDAFADGVSFISLASIYDSELVIPTIVHALGLAEMGDQSPIQLLKPFLCDKHLLIVLDNFEQVLPAAPHLSDLLSSCSHLKILVTSRVVLHVWGEHPYRVQPLEVPNLRKLPKLESLPQIASIALFLQRAQALLPEFQLTDVNARDVAEICHRLDGVPLALELAATHCKLLSPKAILTRLEHPIEMLTGGRRDAPLRHQTLRNMLSWNDDLLTPDEHKLFRRLAIFDKGFTLQAAEALQNVFGDMSNSVLDGITALIDKSMLQQTISGKEEPRLYFLEVLREYGLELLAAYGELQKTRDALASNFIRQFDLDLMNVHFEENQRLNKQYYNQSEAVINLNYVDNFTPRHRNRMSESTALLSSSTYGELTTREIEVLQLLAMGLSNKQIAECLVLSPHTVSGHIQSIFGKLALNSRSAATRYALEHHLA